MLCPSITRPAPSTSTYSFSSPIEMRICATLYSRYWKARNRAGRPATCLATPFFAPVEPAASMLGSLGMTTADDRARGNDLLGGGGVPLRGLGRGIDGCAR